MDIDDPQHELTDVKWLSNSEVGFIGPSDKHTSQAFSVDIASGELRQLTSHPTDVVSFDAVHSRVIYYALEPPESDAQHSPVAAEGRTLGALLEPHSALEKGLAVPVELFTAKRSATGAGTRIAARTTALRVDFQQLWLSPSGKKAITFAPAASWPPYWAEYEVMSPLFAYTQDRQVFDESSPNAMLRTRYRLVDLEANTARPLLDAPSGYLAYNRTPFTVFWIADEASVVISNAFLPLVEDPHTRRARASAPFTAEINLNDGSVRPIMKELGASDPNKADDSDLRIVGMDWDPARKELRVTQDRDGRSADYTIFHRGKTEWSRRKAGSTRSQNTRIEIVESLNAPARLFATAGGRTCPALIFDPNPRSSNFTFGRVEVFQWTDRNHLHWEGGLIFPPDYSPGNTYPLVVQTHGFSRSEFLIDGPSGYSTAYAAQALANAGFVVLQMGENSEAMSLDRKEGAAYAEGIRAAIGKLADMGLVNWRKVGAIGFSRSGWHVLALLVEHRDLIQAATLSDAGILGYVALLLSVGQPPDMARQYGRALGLQGEDHSAERWLHASPIGRLKDVLSPIRLEAMSPMSLIGTWEAYATLKWAERPVDLIYFPKATHVLYRPADRLESQGGNVDWFRYWLQDRRDPDVRKVKQYIRWDELRQTQNARVGAVSDVQ